MKLSFINILILVANKQIKQFAEMVYFSKYWQKLKKHHLFQNFRWFLKLCSTQMHFLKNLWPSNTITSSRPAHFFDGSFHIIFGRV